MQKKQNKSELKEMINEITSISKLLNESYIFDEDDDEFYDENGEDALMGDMTTSVDKIGQIRSMALEGIQEYANAVDSEEYEFFKKIWLMCDKVCSEKDKPKEEI